MNTCNLWTSRPLAQQGSFCVATQLKRSSQRQLQDAEPGAAVRDWTPWAGAAIGHLGDGLHIPRFPFLVVVVAAFLAGYDLRCCCLGCLSGAA